MSRDRRKATQGMNEYIHGMAPANDIEAFRVAPERTQRRINELVGRRGIRESGPIGRMDVSATGLTGDRSMRRGAIS